MIFSRLRRHSEWPHRTPPSLSNEDGEEREVRWERGGGERWGREVKERKGEEHGRWREGR